MKLTGILRQWETEYQAFAARLSQPSAQVETTMTAVRNKLRSLPGPQQRYFMDVIWDHIWATPELAPRREAGELDDLLVREMNELYVIWKREDEQARDELFM